MNHLFSVAVAVASALSALAACSPASIAPPADAGHDSGSVDDASPASDAATPDRACKDYAYARCTRIQTCSPTAIELEFGTVAICEAYYHQSCAFSLTAPSSGATPAHTAGCTAAIAGWACSDIIYGENTPPACASVGGTLATGAACAVSSQCQSTWCNRPVGSACGTCTPPPAAGAPCQSGAQCGPGLSCFNKACAVHVSVGAQCGATAPCNDGLTCVAGVCAAGVTTSGAPCSFAGAGCDQYAGLACNAQSGTCQTLQLASPGEGCGDVANQLRACPAGNCTRGTCVAGAALGAPCAVDGSLPCIAFAECIATSDGGATGTCQLPGVACH